MEETKRRFICSSTNFIICFLIVLPMFYIISATFKIELWKEHFIKWGSTGKWDYLIHETENRILLKRLVRGEHRIEVESKGLTCMHERHSNFCVANKPVRFDTNSHKIYIPSHNQQLQKETLLPYGEKDALVFVTPIQILHGNITPLPTCNYNYDAPLILFSSGGFASNFFHDFSDIIIPLFITSRHFRSDVRFVVTDFQLWFIKKYRKILTRLSGYDIINGSKSSGVHCFPGAIIGLKYHKWLSINSNDNPLGNSMFRFKEFVFESYDLKVKDVSQIQKPRLLLMSRTKSRTILNQDEVVNMMEEIGFEVIIATPNKTKDFDKFIHVVNSCSVMVGVHGAGLTHELFLANGAVLIQVVLIELDWPADMYFGEPAHELGLEYLHYKIENEESSLYDLYGPKHPVIQDPESVQSKGFHAFKDVYLDKQNVTIKVERFRKTLQKAMRYIRH